MKLQRSGSCLLLALLAFGPIHCTRNPVTGKKQLSLYSEAEEIQIGQQSHPEILAQFGRVDSSTLQNYLAEKGIELARSSHRPDLPWNFTVLDSEVVNAFALPGGYVYVTRQILAQMNNEAELAGVLGHEIGHITARHGITQASKAQLAGLGLVAGSIFSETFGQFAGMAELGMSLLFLKYGRDAERQSDRLGVQYMYRAGYDPRELSHFFQVFQTMREDSSQQIPGWLSSHPDPGNRIRDTAEEARQIMEAEPGADLRVNRNEFLGHLEGLVFGVDPREGFVREGAFYHPELRFWLSFPNGWTVQNSKSAVLFMEPNQAAGVQLTLAPSGSASTPEDRARQVARDSSVEFLEGRRLRINNIPAFVGRYRVRNPQTGQVIGVLAAFIDYGNLLYELVGLTPENSYAQYSKPMESVIASFRELREERILAAQPDRVSIYEVRRGGTLSDIARLFPNPEHGVEDLSRLNRLPVDQRLSAGTRVKVIVAGQR